MAKLYHTRRKLFAEKQVISMPAPQLDHAFAVAYVFGVVPENHLLDTTGSAIEVDDPRLAAGGEVVAEFDFLRATVGEVDDALVHVDTRAHDPEFHGSEKPLTHRDVDLVAVEAKVYDFRTELLPTRGHGSRGHRS